MKNLDKIAYDIVCDWPSYIDFDPFYKGIDYSQIIRFYLWDKVGRALRIEHNIDYNEEAVYKQEYGSFPYYFTTLPSKGRFKKGFFNRKKLLFVPYQVSQTHNLIANLLERKDCRVISKEVSEFLSEKNVIKSETINYNDYWHLRLYNAVVESLETKNIFLITLDRILLKKQIKGAFLITEMAENELKRYKPNGVYVPSDNHPPYINYVLTAQKLNIPTFTYQHGLDCEHFFLDDVYADYIALWSENRKEKYIAISRFTPKKYCVTGNNFVSPPKFLPDRRKRKTVLFLTRPHRPIKCYSPTRNYLEGLQILKAILDFLEVNQDVDLIIKPHPMDLISLYEEAVRNSGLENRVMITNKAVDKLFPETNVVVTEDTTSGAESMFYNLPCIHAHLAESNPILPFVDYGAALPGKSKEEISSSLEKAFSLSKAEETAMVKGQKKFLNDFLPFGKISYLSDFIVQNLQ